MKPKIKKAVLLCRVSTKDKQDTQRQENDLKSFCESKGYQVSKVLKENISGSKKNEERGCIQTLLSMAKKKSFDVLIVTELSRLGRNPFEVRKIIEELNGQGISTCIQSLGIETLDNAGKVNIMSQMFLSILNEFSAMERQFIVDRINSGLDNARKNGVVLGRKTGSTESKDRFLKKYSNVIPDVSLSVRKLSRLHSISPATAQKIKSMV